ncbi:beta-1,3-galactosyltransferase 1-like [Physella acuta]|uniref:beta-1,3-galactosyltransferase 1-like n=1 Tax=Physella acuta TaxID=109671 RepID=UPI0027DC4932|nr:beta-1,3-galactosyltransferase 1-like [Physella acuta]
MMSAATTALPKITWVKVVLVVAFIVVNVALYSHFSDHGILPIFSPDSNTSTHRGDLSFEPTRSKFNLTRSNLTQKWQALNITVIDRSQPYSTSELKKHPFLSESVVNPHNYKYVITPRVSCKDRSTIEVIICVPISHNNFKGRETVRATWGSYANVSSHNSILVFFIGLPDMNSAEAAQTQKLILEEAAVYGDILQEDFVDSYNNLSLKSVSILKYVTFYCSKASYVLKADDDMYVNVPFLVTTLRKHKDSNPELSAFVMGSKQVNAHPARSSDSKWYTPVSMFSEDTYPDYVSGTAYVMSAEASWLLYEGSLRVPLFWLEDIYITGICSKKAGVVVIGNDLFSYGKPSVSGCSFRQHISGHRYSLSEIEQIHRELYDSKTVCE